MNKEHILMHPFALFTTFAYHPELEYIEQPEDIKLNHKCDPYFPVDIYLDQSDIAAWIDFVANITATPYCITHWVNRNDEFGWTLLYVHTIVRIPNKDDRIIFKLRWG